METTPKVTDLVRSSFTAKVAVLCTPTASSVIKQFNLNFVQLVQPFAKLTAEATWQDPNNQSIQPKDVHLSFTDIGDWKKPEVDANKNRRLLTNVVTQAPPPLGTSSDKTSPGVGLKAVTITGKSLNYHVNVPARTTWYESWRKTFLKLQSNISGSQHEFLNHFVGCVLVISSSEVQNSEDVANIVGKLSKIQQQHQYDHPNTWILPSVLKYYLILQDRHVNENQAEQVYQNFRTMYGGNFCHLLKLALEKEPAESDVLVPNPWNIYLGQERSLTETNSMEKSEFAINPSEEIVDKTTIVQSDFLHPLSPDCEKPPSIISQNGIVTNGVASESVINGGASLTLHDIDRIQVTVNDFISKALLPYMERQCRNLHDSIISRRGMSKSFFSATKRLFGTASKSAPSIVYPTESVEILSRKLADIYFLFGHYAGAYQLYHQLKKDFYGDAAWLYYSSALELAALSHFMMSQSEPPLAVARAFPVHYVNDAIGHYIEQCRMVDAATRCAIISTECLKQLDNHSESAAIFIRMTSEDCDVRSALMLEQAAYCFLEINSPRKYAMHSVLAGYRYAKAGLRSHSLNSYRQANQVYAGKGWRQAEDHVNFTIGRLQNLLQIPENIKEHLMATLIAPSPQSATQIQTFYKEFLTTLMTLSLKSGNSIPKPHEFFLPQIKFSDMEIRIAVTNLETGEYDSSYTEEVTGSTNWDALEESVVRECIHSSVIGFKPTRLVFNRSLDNTINPSVPCDEQFFVGIPFCNPLKIPMNLRNITLKFDHSQQVKASIVPVLDLEPESTKSLRFSITSSHVGMITMLGVFYELELSPNQRVSFQQSVSLKGPRLNNTKAERCGKIYAKDLRNKIFVSNKLPLLQASVEGLPEALFHAQAANFRIVLEDKSATGSAPDMSISSFIIATENMKDVLQVESPLQSTDNKITLESTGNTYTKLRCEKAANLLRIPCIFKAPQSGDNANLNILILYEIQPSAESSKKSHRVIKLSLKIPLNPAVHLEYNSLKMLDCSTYLGLLRLYNLTVDYSVLVNKIFFRPSNVNVISLCSTGTPTEIDKFFKDEKMKMNKNESRNIILKFNDPENIIIKQSSLSINVQWEIMKSDGLLALGNSQMAIYDSVKSVESPFVFEVHHMNTVYADFSTSPLCSCNIDLKVHSRSSGTFTIQLENNPPKEDLTASGPSQQASGDVFLTGKTYWKLQLEAMKTTTMSYTMAVAWPGVYNAAPKIIVTNSESGSQETYSIHSPIIVAQSQTSTTTSTAPSS